jgi:hypothetical protein
VPTCTLRHICACAMRIAIPNSGSVHALVGSGHVPVDFGRNTSGQFPGVCVPEAGSFYIAFL